MIDFIELIEEQATRHPERIAIIDGDRQMSYGEFYMLVSIISNTLLLQNKNPKVVIDLSQGLEAYVLIIAVLHAGGCYCPLHPDAPPDRKNQIIYEFQPDLILVRTPEQCAIYADHPVSTFAALLAKKSENKVSHDYDGEAISYVIYTSGSTGASKGVQIRRKSLQKFLEWSIPAYAAGEHDIWGQFSYLSFDLSIVDIFTCLCSGATLLAMNDEPARRFRPSGIIEEKKITIWHSVPGAVEFMLINENSRVYDFSSLRLMSFCGEALQKRQVDFLFRKKPDLVIFNTYGPTEATLFCTCQELRADDYEQYCHFTMSIGKPIPGWYLQFRSTENGDNKEVIIYGDYIGKGYAGSIVTAAFGQVETEGRSYPSFIAGDLVTEKEGHLYFSGRKDRQVKVKGHRIEPDEIDLRIHEFTGKSSITVVKKDALYSFIEGKEPINETSVKDFLRTKLEPYKVPNRIFVIAEIPRSANQKADHHKLITFIP